MECDLRRQSFALNYFYNATKNVPPKYCRKQNSQRLLNTKTAWKMEGEKICERKCCVSKFAHLVKKVARSSCTYFNPVMLDAGIYSLIVAPKLFKNKESLEIRLIRLIWCFFDSKMYSNDFKECICVYFQHADK